MSPIPVLGDDLPGNMRELLRDRIDLIEFDANTSAADLARAVGLVTYGHPPIDGPLLDRCPALKVVSNHGVGVDHIDVAAATARNIPVGNTPGCLDRATADMTMALLLATARNIVRGDHFARGPEFLHYDPKVLIGWEVSGSTLGIVGMGRIGREVAKRARAFDMRILYHNRNRNAAAEAELGVEFRSLDELLDESDFVTLNCPLTPETKHLIGAEQLQRMKRSAILINMARGGVVDTDAITQALTDGVIAAAGLDVTEPEPLPRNHPLLGLDNVILLPHLGSASDRTRQRMVEMTVENLLAGIDGKPLPYRVVR
jgi:glyoxylate reductase